MQRQACLLNRSQSHTPVLQGYLPGQQEAINNYFSNPWNTGVLSPPVSPVSPLSPVLQHLPITPQVTPLMTPWTNQALLMTQAQSGLIPALYPNPFYNNINPLQQSINSHQSQINQQPDPPGTK